MLVIQLLPIERRRIRFAVFLQTLQKLGHIRGRGVLKLPSLTPFKIPDTHRRLNLNQKFICTESEATGTRNMNSL